jgi:spore coat protein CotH
MPLPEVSIRSRGKGSRSGVKPSLKVEFDYYDSRQNFVGLKTVVLRANTQDASMMHERVSMELMRKMGLPVPRETHTKLYVNGEYVGIRRPALVV